MLLKSILVWSRSDSLGSV